MEYYGPNDSQTLPKRQNPRFGTERRCLVCTGRHQNPTKLKPDIAPIPKLAKQLQRQRTKKICHGLYDYIQINFCYSSNRLASNRLMLNQVEEIYKKGKVSVGFEPINVDDLIEAYNHIACVNYIIDTATARLSQTYIRKLHSMIGYGTVKSESSCFIRENAAEIPIAWKNT